MAFWGIEVKSGKPFTHTYDGLNGRLHISTATLGTGTAKKKSLVQCNVGNKSPIYLCSLFPEKSECLQINVEFEELEEVIFSVNGPRSIHLSGYFLHGHRRNKFDDNSESYGEDIADSESQRSYDSEEDESDDSFIANSEEGDGSNNSYSADSREEISDKKKPQKGDVDIDGQSKSEAKVLDDLSKSSRDVRPEKGERPKKKRKKQVEDELTPKSAKNGSSGIHGAKRSVDGQSDDKKVKKEESKSQAHRQAVNTDVPLFSEEENVETMSSQIRTFPGGLHIEELKVGKPNGKIATSGKKISIHLDAKLKENGRLVGSTAGRGLFKFRLGEGKVIKGLDVGADGMRVGGKRRLVIPPTMGFGSEGYGTDVPPNSWLVYDVELVKVR